MVPFYYLSGILEFYPPISALADMCMSPEASVITVSLLVLGMAPWSDSQSSHQIGLDWGIPWSMAGTYPDTVFYGRAQCCGTKSYWCNMSLSCSAFQHRASFSGVLFAASCVTQHSPRIPSPCSSSLPSLCFLLISATNGLRLPTFPNLKIRLCLQSWSLTPKLSYPVDFRILLIPD